MTLKSFLRDLRILPRWVILCIDLLILAISCLISYLLRFNFSLTDVVANQFLSGIALYVFCGLMAILLTESYKGIIRFTGLQDGVRIIYMIVMCSIFAVASNLFCYSNQIKNIIPYSVLLISLLCSFLLLFNYRLIVKYIFSYYKNFLIKKSRAARTPRTNKSSFPSSDMLKSSQL